MRIISGKFKFYRFFLNKKTDFKPLSSFLRETIFNTLQFSVNWEQAEVLDLFAGSGSLGFESASRGAKLVSLNDISQENVANLEKTKETLGADNCFISQVHFRQFIQKSQQEKQKFDLIFLDPPFSSFEFVAKSLSLFEKDDLLKENAIVVVIASQKIESFPVNLRLLKVKKHSRVYLHFFQKIQNNRFDSILSKSNFVIISGPSGAGKSTIVERLLKIKDLNLDLSISSTTRPRRSTEQKALYEFISEKKFSQMIENDEFLEYAKYVDSYYGTSLKNVEKLVNEKKNVLFEIEILGARILKSKIPKILWIFIFPPNLKELKLRLLARGSEDEKTIQKRLKKAHDEILEINSTQEYDFFVLNIDIDETVKKISDFLRKKWN